MKTRLTTLLLSGALALAAQTQPQRQPDLTAVKSYLGLSDAQVTQLQSIRQSEMQANQSIRDQMVTKEKSLQQLLDSGSTDAAAIGTLEIAINALRKQLSDSRSNFRDQAKAVLTTDQQTKLKALQDAASLAPTIAEAGALGLLNSTGPFGGGPGMGPMGGFRPGGAGFARRPPMER